MREDDAPHMRSGGSYGWTGADALNAGQRFEVLRHVEAASDFITKNSVDPVRLGVRGSIGSARIAAGETDVGRFRHRSASDTGLVFTPD